MALSQCIWKSKLGTTFISCAERQITNKVLTLLWTRGSAELWVSVAIDQPLYSRSQTTFIMIKLTSFEFKTSKAFIGVTFVAILCGVSLLKEWDAKVTKPTRMTQIKLLIELLSQQTAGCQHIGNVLRKSLPTAVRIWNFWEECSVWIWQPLTKHMVPDYPSLLICAWKKSKSGVYFLKEFIEFLV